MQTIPYAWLLIAACFPLLFIPQIVSLPVLSTVLLLALLLLITRSKYLHYYGVALFFFFISQFTAHGLVSTITAWSERTVSAEVRVSEVQELNGRIRVSLTKVEGQWRFPVYDVWIGNIDASQYCLGQHWLMRLRLRPVHSLLNEGGYDSQRNALAKDTPFTGKIHRQQLLDPTCSVRHRLEQAFVRRSASSPWQGISRALVFGLRDRIPPEVNTLFRETGIGHLMAISGMHVGLIFLLTRRIIKWVQLLFPARFSRAGGLEAISWLASAGYCLLSGAQPSALRALFALTFWLVAKRFALNLSSFHILLLCVASLLAINPLMILSDSLWLSVLAVLALLIWYRWFPLPPTYRQAKRYAIIRLVHLQLGIMVLLLPIQIFFFHGTSLAALGANLVAIPIVSLGLLPLALLLAIPWPDLLYSSLLLLHDTLFRCLFALLGLQKEGWVFLPAAPQVACLLWGGLFIGRFYLWRSSPLSLCALLISLASWRVQPSEILWRVDMLDVGHGLAMVISQRGEGLIYDTGNRWQVGDAGERIIVPWLIDQGITPVMAVISHRHSDHSGGLASIKKIWPQLVVRTSYRYPGALACRRGDHWQWGRLAIQVLWPEQFPTAGQNNDSCVLYISDGRHHLLLTGDLEKKAEQRLVELVGQTLPVDWLQVPHHGSRTSSSPLLLRTLRPNIAIASVARYNAWRLPATNVVKRYQQQGIQWLDTAQAGQISIRVTAGNSEILQLRDQISPRWYHQWFGVKPDYG